MTTTTSDLNGVPLTHPPGGGQQSQKPADIVRRSYPKPKGGRK